MATIHKKLTALTLIAAMTVSSLSLPAMAQNAPVGVQQQAPIGMQQAPMAAQTMNRISWSQMVKGLEDQGFIIREIETEHDGWKAEVFDKNGAHYKLYLNGQGAIVHQKYD